MLEQKRNKKLFTEFIFVFNGVHASASLSSRTTRSLRAFVRPSHYLTAMYLLNLQASDLFMSCIYKNQLSSSTQILQQVDVFQIKKYKNDPGIILAVPRGGIPVAYSVAKELGFPIELSLAKKIGHPGNKEYAIGAASLTDYFMVPDENVLEEYVNEEVKKIRLRLNEMQQKFMGDSMPEDLEGKTVIVIDDGIATGNTLLATINVLRKSNPGKIIIGAPVASESAVERLSYEVDEVVAVLIPDSFYGVAAFYEDFAQGTDEEAILLLDELRKLLQPG